MPPVRDLLEYYLSLIKVQDFFSLTFTQRRLLLLLLIHDFFSERISLIDVCSFSQYLIFEPNEKIPEQTDLEYIIWCCSELIPVEDQHRIYDQPRQTQADLIEQLKKYLVDNLEKVQEIVLDRSENKLVC